MASLQVTSGPLAGQTVEVTGELTIGRQNADLTIDDPQLSRAHAVLRVLSGGRGARGRLAPADAQAQGPFGVPLVGARRSVVRHRPPDGRGARDLLCRPLSARVHRVAPAAARATTACATARPTPTESRSR